MNLLSYAETEFATFAEKPFNELDAALFTQLAMVRVEVAALAQGAYKVREDGVLVDETGSDELALSLRDLLCAECFDRMFTGLAADAVRECLLAAAMSPRYRRVMIIRYQTVLDASRTVQFSATAFSCDEFTFVAFRGTDSSLVGWREDFNLAYRDSIEAQTLGTAFVEAQLGAQSRFAKDFYLGGHSKGGNIAEYVLLRASDVLRSRIAAAYSFDGPGFKQDVFDAEAFAAIAPTFHKLVPQDSIIGMILYSASSFDVVQSTQAGFMQHDLFSWEIDGDAFVRCDGLTNMSQTIDAATSRWLCSYSAQQIEEFVNALFDAADASGALDLHTLFGGGMQSVQYLRAAAAQAGEHADVLMRFASDLAEALRASVADQASDALRSAREQVVDRAEDTWHALRDALPGAGSSSDGEPAVVLAFDSGAVSDAGEGACDDDGSCG